MMYGCRMGWDGMCVRPPTRFSACRESKTERHQIANSSESLSFLLYFLVYFISLFVVAMRRILGTVDSTRYLLYNTALSYSLTVYLSMSL